MADSLYELLQPYFETSRSQIRPDTTIPGIPIAVAKDYLTHLTTSPLTALVTTERQFLTQESDRNDLLLRTLASRSHKIVINSSDHLSTLHDALPAVISSAKAVKDAVPGLDEEALRFSTIYSKSTIDNKILDRRRKATQLSRSVDKVSDILELPMLLASVISSASTNASSSGTSFSTALDVFAHIKRLSMLYPDSALVSSVLAEAEEAMKEMTTNLITSLRGQNIRLAAAIRTIGWLRRVSPELASPAEMSAKSTAMYTSSTTHEGIFGSLFLTARLANLLNMLEALSPLRDLADQETARRSSNPQSGRNAPITQTTRKPSPSGSYISSNGQQTERYLKRYIEIFREQSFATISMYRNVFPIPDPPTNTSSNTATYTTALLPIPSALSTFPIHLVDLLTSTLKAYLPNVTDPSARESLLTQVLYAAGSLGRLGADFGMLIALLEDDDEHEDQIGDKYIQDTKQDGLVDAEHADGNEAELKGEEEAEVPEQVPEWVRVMQKHRIQAGRLEALAAGQDQTGIRRSSSETVVK